MPVAGRWRYQVGEPYYFYDVRAEVSHEGKFKEVVLVNEEIELKKKRPFLLIM